MSITVRSIYKGLQNYYNSTLSNSIPEVISGTIMKTSHSKPNKKYHKAPVSSLKSVLTMIVLVLLCKASDASTIDYSTNPTSSLSSIATG